MRLAPSIRIVAEVSPDPEFQLGFLDLHHFSLVWQKPCDTTEIFSSTREAFPRPVSSPVIRLERA